MMTMTYDENYGAVPSRLLTIYRRHNVSPADHDRILMALGFVWSDPNILWNVVLEFVLAHIDNGKFSLPMYL